MHRLSWTICPSSSAGGTCLLRVLQVYCNVMVSTVALKTFLLVCSVVPMNYFIVLFRSHSLEGYGTHPFSCPYSWSHDYFMLHRLQQYGCTFLTVLFHTVVPPLQYFTLPHVFCVDPHGLRGLRTDCVRIPCGLLLSTRIPCGVRVVRAEYTELCAEST